MINKSIAYRLSIYISLAVIGVFLTFIVIAFYFNSEILKDNITYKASALGSKIMMTGERQLVSTKEVTLNISEQILFYAQNDTVEMLVENLMKNFPYFNAIHINIDSNVPDIKYHNYYFFRSKDSIISNKSNELIYHCLNEKKIFDEKISTGIPGWTRSFTCKKNSNQVVSYYSPIRIINENNELITIGSVISELSLLELNDSIKSLKLNEKGQIAYSVIVTQDGTFLTHPEEEYILNRNLYSLPEKVSELDSMNVYKLLNDGLSGTIIAYPEYLNYQKSWVYYTPIKETGWTLIFVVPYDDLFEPLYIMILQMLFFSVIGILIIFFIVSYISKRLIQPLSSVTSELKKFSSLTGEISNTSNEVALVTESLDYLQNWYEKFKVKTLEDEQKNSQREHDLLEASDIQMSLINTDFSIFKKRTDIDLFALYKPARTVSGDLYDFIFLDNDRLFFTIGDVSGKGVSAAFFMSVAQTLLKSNSRLIEPAKIVRATNHRLFSVNQHQFFLTLFCGILDLKTGILKYCNAAHTPTLIIKSDGEIIDLAKSQGMPLGLYPNRKYGESFIMLEPGDSIILFSDGVSEQQNINKKHYGINRFCKFLSKHSDLNPEELVGKIENRINKFKGIMEQNDDITVLALKFKKRKRPD